MLKAVKGYAARSALGRGPYCGPVAIAAVTGKDVTKIEEAIQRNRNNGRMVIGTFASDLSGALHEFGFRMIRVSVSRTPEPALGDKKIPNPTLVHWLRTRKPADGKSTFILNVGHHWIAVEGRRICDTYTSGEPTFIRSGPHRRRRVLEAYRIERNA